MKIWKSLIKHFLVIAVVAGAWSCTSTKGLQHANHEDDDVYFSRKDREQARIAKETEVRNNPTVSTTTSTGMEVNPTYGTTTKKNDQTNVNPEYVENYRNTNNSPITNNSNNYSSNEYYTEYRANRVQVPRDTYDSWGNTNNGVFYDPYLDPASPFYDPYSVQSSVVPFSVRIGWGRSGWRYRRWYRRSGWYNPYYRNDYWSYRNSWNYGGYGGYGYYNSNPWCPTNYNNRPIYVSTRVDNRRPATINRSPRRAGAGRRGNTILTNRTATKRQGQGRRTTRSGTNVNKRAAVAGKRYKRTRNSGKRVSNSGTRTTPTRTTRTRTRRSTYSRPSTRTRRSNTYSRPSTRTRSSSYNRSTNRNSSYQRRSNNSRSNFSRPSTRTRTRTRTTSRPSRSSSPKKSGSSKRRKR